MITGRATETGWSLMRSARRSVSGTKNISSSIRHQNFKKMQKLKVEKLKVYMGSTGYICEPLLKGAWRRSVSGTAWGSCSGEKHCFFTIITMITPLLPPSWPSQWSWSVVSCWGLNDLLVAVLDRLVDPNIEQLYMREIIYGRLMPILNNYIRERSTMIVWVYPNIEQLYLSLMRISLSYKREINHDRWVRMRWPSSIYSSPQVFTMIWAHPQKYWHFLFID